MYICLECDHVFEEGEERIEREYQGECHGSPSYETYRVCPECGEDYDEAVRCAECGYYTASSKMDGNICPECVKKAEKELQIILLSCFNPASREYLEDTYGIT